MNLNLYSDSLRIEINELSSNLKDYKIIDVRSKEQFELAHIEGSINLYSNLTYNNKTADGKITEPNKMQRIIRNLGLNVDDKIVIYDDGTFFDASRVFWTLEVYGFKDVKLLNGGFEFWEDSGYQVSQEITTVTKSNYIATLNNKRLSTKFSTQIATRNKSNIILDARTHESYNGNKSIAKRFGHIPKAINIPAVYNINKNQFKSKLKDISELRNIYKDVEKDKKIVIYCSIGRVAATNYFALRELGYNVANYDASWKEWGNDSNLPIINLSKKN
jgi:thiosulfate/3-mercaptopyruvate sulfurtransferase